MCLPKAYSTSPAAFILLLKDCQPIWAETCEYPSIKDSMELNVFKFFSLTTVLFLEVNSANQLGWRTLLCQRKLLT